MKRILCILSGLAMLLLVVSGCAYNLHYTISGRGTAASVSRPAVATFAVEPLPASKNMNRIVESNLIELTYKSLQARGWKEVPAAQADYIFRVSYTLTTDEEVFRHLQYMYGPGGIYSRRRKPHFFKSTVGITVLERKTRSVWTGTGTITRTDDDILLVARYIVDSLVSQFPKQGRWKIHRKIHLYGSSSAQAE